MPEDLIGVVDALPRPVCAELTPFTCTAASRTPGYVALRFDPQPAFGNHFGNVQGGFAMALLDALFTVAIYLDTGELAPTLSVSAQFVAPLPIGVVHGEGRMVRSGRAVAFAEATLATPDGLLCVTGTATAALRGNRP